MKKCVVVFGAGLSMFLGGLVMAVLTSAGTFPKLGFWDPYCSLQADPRITLAERNSYYGQIDSCGINGVVGTADSNTTKNTFGLNYTGQDDRALWRTSAGDDLTMLKAAGFHVIMEAENVDDPLAGYSFCHPLGWKVSDSTASGNACWQCIPGTHSAGVALDCMPYIKSFFKFPRLWHTRITLKATVNTTTDTVCIVRLFFGGGLRNTLILRGVDFSAPNQWQDFSMWTNAVGEWAGALISVEWKGVVELGIDKVTFSDYNGERAIEVVSPDTLRQKMTEFYARINPAQHRAFMFHEFFPSQNSVSRWWQDAADGVAPYHRAVGIGNWGLPYIFHEVPENEHQPFSYEFTIAEDSSTNSGSSSVQHAYDRFISQMHDRALACKQFNVAMVPYIQTWGDYDCLTGLPETARDPTANEINAQGMLAMAYGSRGIAYFLYPSLLCDDSAYMDTTLNERLPLAAGYMGSNRRTDYRGMVDWSFELRRYVPNYKYWAVKSLNAHLDSLWRTLEGLTWADAGPGYTAHAIPGSFIDSVTSLTFAGNPYAEVGLFTGAGGAKYFMLVNRRSLHSDRQDVRVYMPLTSDALIVDQYSYDSLYVGSCGGAYSVSVALQPGEGRLFRIVPLGWTTPNLSLHSSTDGSAYGDGYGWAVASVGDVDADGTPDYGVGAPWADPNGVTDGGAVYVYSGKTGLLLYWVPGMQAFAGLGWSICALGDVNADGHDDFVVGAPGWDEGGVGADVGWVGIISGANTTALHYWAGTGNYDSLGMSVADAGDLDHDGKPDFIVGAPGFDNYGTKVDVGAVYFCFGDGWPLGPPSGGVAAGDRFGYSVAAADVDGNGTKEFVIGAPYADNAITGVDAGAVFVGQWRRNGDGPGAHLGWSVACAGDIHGDGNEDIAVGAPYTSPSGGLDSAGVAFVFPGEVTYGASGMENPSADYMYKKTGANIGERLGWSVASAGDVDGDCRADFCVGAPGVSAGGATNAGATYIYSGNGGAQLNRVDGQFNGDELGCSVAAAVRPFGQLAAYLVSGMPFADRGGHNDAGSATVAGLESSCDCPNQGDVNPDLVVDVFDVIAEIGIAFGGGLDVTDPTCPTSRGDVINNDAAVDVFDVIQIIAIAFSSGFADNPCTP